MTKTVIALGDLHCGHRAGLTPPENMSDINAFKKTCKLQCEMWARYISLVKQYYKPDLVIANGDMIDGKGDKSGGTELWSTDRLQQSEAAVKSLKAWNAKKYVLTYGTAYHVSKDGEDFESLIADKLNCKIHNHAQINVNGIIFDVKHHVGSSSVPHGKHTAIARERLQNLLWVDAESCTKANIVIRSHVHYFNYCGGGDWLGMTLPALQAPCTKYGMRRCSNVGDWGIVIFHISDKGEYTWKSELARLETARSELIKL